MASIKIAISIPSEGNTQAEAYDNRLYWAVHLGIWQERSKNTDKPVEFYWYTAGRILTPFARETLTQHALQGGMDYICMIDDDMIVYDPEILEKLLAHNVDIVAPLAFTRNPPHLPVMYEVDSGFDPVLKKEYYQTKYIKNYPKDKLVEVDATGFGMVLINLNVVKAMKPPYFFSTTGTGEDVYFCLKAKKEAGAKIFIDTSLKLGHLGAPNVITEETYENLNKIDDFRKVYGEYKRDGYTDSSQLAKPIDQGRDILE